MSAEGNRVEGDRVYGCVFCKTGKEMAVASMMQAACPDIRATTARQEKPKTVAGKKTRVEAILLPGYVFFEAPLEMESIAWMPMMHVIRVLKEDGDWRLAGSDERFARWLFGYNGLLSFSKAYQEGSRVRIISGPLKDMEGCIRRVDRRGHSGQVALEFDHKTVTVWLGFDLVDPVESLGGVNRTSCADKPCFSVFNPPILRNA